MADRDVDYVDLPMYHDELAQALNFTPSDLESNQQIGDLARAKRPACVAGPVLTSISRSPAVTNSLMLETIPYFVALLTGSAATIRRDKGRT